MTDSIKLPTARKNATADQWRVLSNQLFLEYVRKRLGENPHAWGAFARGHYGRSGEDPSSFPQAASTGVAVSYKNAFVKRMTGLQCMPESDVIRRNWDEHMACAERDIAAKLAVAP